MATERSLERCGIDSFDLLLLHNPDRTGYTSEVVWEGMAALREAGLTRLIGVAPGPANGFTLDLIDCLERFGALIDWAMIILNPLEPWPGELCLDAAAAAEVQRDHARGRLRRAVLRRPACPGRSSRARTTAASGPAGWIEQGRERLELMRPVADRAGLTMIQLACQWNLAHAPVACVVPTLIQEVGARRSPDRGASAPSWQRSPPRLRLTAEDVDAIRAIGDNTGCMALKGASPEHSGEERPDRWDLDDHLAEVAERWGIAPDRQLVKVPAARTTARGAAPASSLTGWRRPSDSRAGAAAARSRSRSPRHRSRPSTATAPDASGAPAPGPR